MKKQLELFLFFLNKFGLRNGFKLFLKFYKGNVENIKLPNLQHSFSLRPATSDIYTFYQVFINRNYDIELDKIPKVIIDGGANIGLFTIKMKNLYPDSTIICIEPDLENYQLLEKNVSKYKNVFCENAGIWTKDTTLKVHDKYKMGKWAMVVEEDLIEGNVKAISLNSLLEKYAIEDIDILKLDIETSEKQVFSENYEKWLPKVKLLIVELHDKMEEGCSKPFFEAINKTFTSYKYSMAGDNTVIKNNDIV